MMLAEMHPCESLGMKKCLIEIESLEYIGSPK